MNKFHDLEEIIVVGDNAFATKENTEGYLAKLRKVLASASLAAVVAACASGELERIQSLGLKETGLRPVYPTEVSCPEIDAFFAATTNKFGRPIPFDYFVGHHQGVDITVAEGTEVLAMASGRVIAKVQTPNGSWALYVQHLSMDTGMKEITFSQYAHIKKETPVKITDFVQRGQVIAYSGSTGTFYPHLHVTTFASPSDWFNILEKHGGQYLTFSKGRWIDPLLFLSGTLNIDEIPDKKVKVPYQSEKSDAKVRWPLRCKGEKTENSANYGKMLSQNPYNLKLQN